MAAVIFTNGCPLRCPYCHNPEPFISAVEYVALDVKTLPAYYDRVAAAPVSATGTIAATIAVTLLRSMSILRGWRDEASYADTSVLTVSQSFEFEAAFHKSWFV